MTLIVAPDPNAEAYASVAESDLYHARRGNAAWASVATSDKEAALRRATDYMVARYSGRWRGEVVDSEQVLDWPRYGVWSSAFLLDSATVPAGVRHACAELALRSATGTALYTDVGPQEVTSERVGPIAVTYANRQGGQTRFPLVDEMLSKYLIGSTNQVRLIRG